MERNNLRRVDLQQLFQKVHCCMELGVPLQSLHLGARKAVSQHPGGRGAGWGGVLSSHKMEETTGTNAKSTHPLTFSCHVPPGQSSVSTTRAVHSARKKDETKNVSGQDRDTPTHHQPHTRHARRTDAGKAPVETLGAHELGDFQQGGHVAPRNEKGVHLGQQAEKNDACGPNVDGWGGREGSKKKKMVRENQGEALRSPEDGGERR